MDAELATRLNVVRWTVCAGLLSAMALAPRLWVADRGFPTLPVFPGLPELPQLLTVGLAALFVAALLLVATGRWLRIALALSLCAAAILVLFDITRLQPWFYQYLLLLAPFLLKDREKVWRLCAIVVAGTYFCSGFQKLNLAFANEIFPWLFSIKAFAPWLGIAAALLESSIGVALLIPRLRKIALIGLVTLHLAVLAALGPMGHNFNSVVWPWNLCLPLIAFALFTNRNANLTATRGELAFLAFAAVLPFLSLFNLWDDNLSSSLYSGRTRDALLKLGPSEVAKLQVPKTATRHENGDAIIDVTAWAFADLNVPPYPAPRTYRMLAEKVPGATLYIRERTLLEGATHTFKQVPQ